MHFATFRRRDFYCKLKSGHASAEETCKNCQIAALRRLVFLWEKLPSRKRENVPRPPPLVNQVTRRSYGQAANWNRTGSRVLTLSAQAHTCYFLYLPCPGGGMADAEDLKSSGDFSSCGFDSHPGHHSIYVKLLQLMQRPLPRTRRVTRCRDSVYSGGLSDECCVLRMRWLRYCFSRTLVTSE